MTWILKNAGWIGLVVALGVTVIVLYPLFKVASRADNFYEQAKELDWLQKNIYNEDVE